MTAERARGVPITVVLSATGLLVVVPIGLVLMNAFRSPREYASSGPWTTPGHWTLTNFSDALGEGEVGVAMARSALVIVLLLATQLPISAMAAYAFAFGQFRGRRTLYLVTVVSLAVPAVALVIPLYLMMAQVGLRETLGGLVLPWSLGSAFAVVLLRESFDTIPREQIDAARLDGAGELVVLARVVIPQSLPILAVLAVVTLVTHWNSFLWPQIIAGTKWPVATVATAALQGRFSTNWTVVLAGCSLMIIPVLLMFTVVQRAWSPSPASWGGVVR
jgi:multiple sugar transport system permease protein